MIKDWEIVYITGKRHLAEMAKQILIDNEIDAVILSKKDSSYLFGDIEVYVHENNLEKGKKLIEEFEKNIKIE
jgi:hypothetical protein